jgi:cell division protein FtsI/penicillin-binding protein 2
MASIFSIRAGLFAGLAALVGIGTAVWADSTADVPAMVIEAEAGLDTVADSDEQLSDEAAAAAESASHDSGEVESPPEDDAAEPMVAIPAVPPSGAGDAFLNGAIDLDDMIEVDGVYQITLADGRTAVLTIDPAIQKAAFKALRAARAPYGAIVVMATDGRILAYAGRRSAEPKKHEDYSLPGTVWAPAASVFKVITAAALVDAGVSPSREVCFHGGKRSVRASNLVDSKRKDRQCHDLALGVAKSLNALIAKLAHNHLDTTSLTAMARSFGFDSAHRFALDVEANRMDIPDKTTDELEFARVAAGFWHTSLSPMGGANIASTVATGGMSVTPRIVAELVDADGTRHPIEGVAPTRAIDEDVAKKVAKMMVGTTIRGSARKGFRDKRGRKYLKGIDIGGKTGTLSKKDDGYLEYSWFVGFGPSESPEVVVSALLGNGELWHLKAHTVARMVLQATL